jgi:predicted nucleic acid-binding Zn ribbon protein
MLMPKCRNPECGKEIPKGSNYCSEDCLRRHLQLKKSKQQKTENGEKLTSEEDIWLGQGRRKRAMETILKLAKELCPIPYKRFVCIVSYRTGLSYRKIADDYLEVLLEIGLLKRNENILTVAEAETV